MTQTRIIPVNPEQPEAEVIRQAADVLRSGGLVAFPTETVYGLGANALDAEAIMRIYRAKGRPANNPLIVHIAQTGQLEQVAVNIPDVARQLAKVFWPGPLTLVLKRHARIPESVSLGRDTAAVRMPSHPVARALIEAAGVPVVAPSANRFTRPSATSAEHVLNDLTGSVDMILDGGPTPIGVESTVLDVTVDPPVLLRPGGVTLEALREYVPNVRRYSEAISIEDAQARPASPGMMSKHYSPQAELLLFSGPFEFLIDRMRQTALERINAGQRVGLLVADVEQPLFADLKLHVSPLGSTPEQIAHTLFAALRDLDAQDADVILAHLMQPEGLGTTINDRLLRAAEGRVIKVDR
jgi:L-threonylcarbamoyladenylate synthase